MNDVLVVDGYNLLHKMDDLKDIIAESLEHARDILIDILQNYQGYCGSYIIVVFDGHYVANSRGSSTDYQGLTVVFTKEHESADYFIEKLVSSFPMNYQVTVVTSDWLEQSIVMGKGALRRSSRELIEDIRLMEKAYQQRKKVKLNKFNDIDNQISGQIRETLVKWRKKKL